MWGAPWGIAFGQQLATYPRHELTYIPLETSQQPINTFLTLKKNYETAFILESVEGPRRLARFSFLGFEPQATIRVEKGHAEVLGRRKADRRITTCDDPLAVLSNYTTPLVDKRSGERYTGGLVGYSSYDLTRYFEKIPRKGRKSHEFPDLEFGFFEDGIAFDHLKRKAYYFHRGENRIENVKSSLREVVEDDDVSFGKARSNITQEKFCEKVEVAKEHIRSGDIFQAVLS